MRGSLWNLQSFLWDTHLSSTLVLQTPATVVSLFLAFQFFFSSRCLPRVTAWKLSQESKLSRASFPSFRYHSTSLHEAQWLENHCFCHILFYLYHILIDSFVVYLIFGKNVLILLIWNYDIHEMHFALYYSNSLSHPHPSKNESCWDFEQFFWFHIDIWGDLNFLQYKYFNPEKGWPIF